MYSINFPLIHERTGYRRGPRYRRVPNTEGLFGARACAARMVHSAILYRNESADQFGSLDDQSRAQKYRKASRLGMRGAALMARMFAGQIVNNDPRIDIAMHQRSELVRSLSKQTEPRQ